MILIVNIKQYLPYYNLTKAEVVFLEMNRKGNTSLSDCIYKWQLPMLPRGLECEGKKAGDVAAGIRKWCQRVVVILNMISTELVEINIIYVYLLLFTGYCVFTV